MIRKTEAKAVEPETVDSPETADTLSVEQGHYDPESGRVFESVTHMERERQGAPNR
jgi:hypothetical protein